jgi:hypothetical protein
MSDGKKEIKKEENTRPNASTTNASSQGSQLPRNTNESNNLNNPPQNFHRESRNPNRSEATESRNLSTSRPNRDVSNVRGNASFLPSPSSSIPPPLNDPFESFFESMPQRQNFRIPLRQGFAVGSFEISGEFMIESPDMGEDFDYYPY